MIQRKVDLQHKNTLRLNAIAQAYCEITDLQSLTQALTHCREQNLKILPLGDGSNVILPPHIPFCVFDIKITGIKPLRETANAQWVEVGAGENWHQWVMHSIAQQWYGLENLALIPGRVGAAPIQNIGAYGCEVNSVVESVNYIAIDDDTHSDINAESGQPLQIKTLNNAQCQFRYRDSIFKQALANKVIITSVVFKLAKRFKPLLTYPALADQLPPAQQHTALQVANAVIAIRSSKLPDPAQLPNVGSFFKNVELNARQLEQFLKQNPNAPHFKAPASAVSLNNSKDIESAAQYRIPAAWLIDQCGLKGYRSGDIGMHNQQALVLVHYLDDGSSEQNTNRENSTSSEQVIAFAARIADKVKQRFGFELQREPRLIPARL